jgi:hypothetical protein
MPSSIESSANTRGGSSASSRITGRRLSDALVAFGALAKEAATGKDAAVQMQTSSSVNIKA